MKKLYATCIVFFIVFSTFANPVITADNNNGRWRNNSTWDLNRRPKDGDTVIIPAGITVILDNNQNLSNAVLFIKVYGTLEIRNGGRLSMDFSSTIIVYEGGIITAHNGAGADETIRIGNVIKFRGTEDDKMGPAISDATTGASPNGFNHNTLPVKLIGFNVARKNNDVLIEWSTSQEANSSHYEIQRSENGSAWITIANVSAAGNSSVTKNYSYTDRNNTAKVSYYRIKQVDQDGRFEITAVRSVKMETGNIQVKISSGSNNSVYLHFSQQVRSNVIVKVMTMNGQVVKQQTISNPVGQQNVSVQSGANKGIYVVSISDGQNLNTSGQVFLQ